MDTTTKMFFVATMDDVYLEFLSVLIDVRMKKVTKETVEIAKKIETSFPDLFDTNNWLKIVAGTNVDNIDDDWKSFLNGEVKEEFFDFSQDYSKGE